MTQTTLSLPEEATARIVGSSAHLAGLSRVVVSPTIQPAIAVAYHKLPSWDPHALPAYAAFVAETAAQWEVLASLGLRLIIQESDPYETAGDMIEDVEANRTICVYASAVTGGHPYMTDAQNDLFRGVHDVMGHAAARRGFDRHGEEAAYRAHAACYSFRARLALTTETRGQNACLIQSGSFPEQKVALLPPWCHDVHLLEPINYDEGYAAREQARTFQAANGLPW